MKKTISILFVVLTVLFSFSGCQKENDAVSYPLNEQDAALSEDLFGFTAALNGRVFKFPQKYETFQKTGWTLSKKLSENTLKTDQYSIYEIEKGDLCTEAYFANLGEKEQPLKNCLVCGVVANAEQGVSLTLPKKVSLNSEKKTVTKLYGEPQKTEKTEKGEILYYKKSDLSGLKLTFRDEKLFEADYFDVRDPSLDGASDKVPAAVKNYKAPKELSEKLSDFTFYLYGHNYTMPLPVKELLKNGWIMASKKQEYIPAKETVKDAVKLTYANRTLTLDLDNRADYPTKAENCFVKSIESVHSVKLDLTLANGCRVGSTESNLLNTFKKSDFTSVQKSGKKKIYTYKKDGCGTLKITVDSDGYIGKIKISSE